MQAHLGLVVIQGYKKLLLSLICNCNMKLLMNKREKTGDGLGKESSALSQNSVIVPGKLILTHSLRVSRN